MSLQHNGFRADEPTNSRRSRRIMPPHRIDPAGKRCCRSRTLASRLLQRGPMFIHGSSCLSWGRGEDEKEVRGGGKPSGNQWRPESREIGARLDGALLIFLMCLSSQANLEESKNPLIYYFIHTPHLLLIRPW